MFHSNFNHWLFIRHKKLAILSVFIFSTIFSTYHLAYFGKYTVNLVFSNKDDTEEQLLPKIEEFRWCPNDVSLNPNINCESLFNGDKTSVKKMKKWKSPCSYNDSQTAKMTENCTAFKANFVFWSRIREKILHSNKTYSDSDPAGDYPLAFVIMGARNGEQIIRLFQSIYLKKNLYCITYDNKSSVGFKRTLQNLDKCYENVLMPTEFVDIWWAGYSILESAMNCLKVLVNQKQHRWKYVQILSYNDYPLRTNEEMIEIMQIFNGAQDSLLSRHSADRSRKFFKVNKTSTIMNNHLDKSKENLLKPLPPGDLIEYKGSLATTMSRQFVEFMFENSIAQKLYEWCNTTYMAEEIYFSTLIHNLHINPPGGFPGACLIAFEEFLNSDKPYISRYQIWDSRGQCKGMSKFHSCVYGVADLIDLIERPELMAHKVYLEFQPATYYCLAELHYNRTMYPDSYSYLNINFYESLPAVQYQRLLDKSTFKC